MPKIFHDPTDPSIFVSRFVPHPAPAPELDDPEKRPRVWSPELWEEIWEKMVV